MGTLRVLTDSSMHRSVPSKSITLHCMQCLLGGFKRSAPALMFLALGSFRPRFLLKNRSIAMVGKRTMSREKKHCIYKLKVVN